MDVVHELEAQDAAGVPAQVAPVEDSPLAHARLHRQLTVEEAARRAGLHPEEVRWLEEGRVYRFPSADHALLATLLLASALGIDHREALELAGRPVPPRALQVNPWSRLAVLAGIALAAVALVGTFELAQRHNTSATNAARAEAGLPAPWTIKVDVLNGSGDINATRQLASRIGALGYTVAKVGRADSFRYLQTVVYYPPRGNEIALRLAKQIGADAKPLPGGTDPRHLVIVAGPATVANQSG
jgi:transcriptional regulator with XRE-family HTH domain